MKTSRFFFIALSIFLPVSLFAATVEQQDSYALAPSVVIHDNLYTAGHDVTISGTVLGDLIGAGAQVISQGRVESDALLSGGDVSISNVVKGDLRVMGGSIILSGEVDGDFVALGGSVTVLPEAVIKGDVIIAGGDVRFSGHAFHTVRILAGQASVNGIVEGNLNFRGGEFSLGSNATINGDLKVVSDKAPSVPESAVVKGAKDFSQGDFKPISKGLFASIFGFIALSKLIFFIIAALLLVWFFPKATHAVTSAAFPSFWKSFLIGLGIFFFTPIFLAILFISFFGIGLAIFLLFVYMLFIFLALVYGGIIFGTLLYAFYTKRKEVPENISWKIALPGVLVLFLASLAPVIGGSIGAVFFFVTLGALSEAVYRSFLVSSQR